MSDEPLDPIAVAAFLRRRSDFLLDFPDLAAGLKLPKDAGANTASLASYQIEVLREKNHSLSTKLHQLIQVAQDNEVLMQRVHLLALRLLKARNLGESLQQIAASLREDFHTDLVRMALIDMPDPGIRGDWLMQFREHDPALAAFESARRDRQPLCGRLKREKLVALFGAQADQVASAVLIPLDPVAILCVGSQDPNRFHPGMGTTFLEMMSELVRVTLAVQGEKTP